MAIMDDADQAVEVLRRSIIELCVGDHRNDPDTIEMLLANKTPEQFRSWLGSADQRLLVAERDDVICAVGELALNGEITLNYVAPGYRFQGISKLMLGGLEQVLRDNGQRQAGLVSTETAHGFYRSVGYVDAGEPVFWGTLPGYPMVKAIG